MKKILLAFSLIGVVCLSSCDNGNDGCLEIRVITGICGMSVVQVVNGDFPGDLVTWTNYEGERFDNVFGTFIDPCLIGEIGDDSRLFIEVIDEPIDSQCAVCLALPANMPENFYNIRQIADCSVIGDL